jgi:environmental stress-induced protein Ves
MPVQILGPDDFRAMPWRNGRGTTIEMAHEDDAGGVMLWRISAADVVEAGQFSAFPGVDRVLTLIEGPGFDLDFSGHGRVRVEMLKPVVFSGDWTTQAEAVLGPSRDLNVMTARGRASALVNIHRGAGAALQAADRSLFLCLDGPAVLTTEAEEYHLAPGQLARFAEVGDIAIREAGMLLQVDVRLLG